jgi:hypothetical protein
MQAQNWKETTSLLQYTTHSPEGTEENKTLSQDTSYNSRVSKIHQPISNLMCYQILFISLDVCEQTHNLNTFLHNQYFWVFT